MGRILVSFFALLLLCCGVTPAFAVDTTTISVEKIRSFALERGESLWSEWKKLGPTRPAWEAYWKDSCTLSRIPCTDKVWRSLPVGQVIVTPRSAEDIEADTQRQMLAIEKQKAEIAQERAIQLEKQVEKLEEDLERAKRDNKLLWGILALSGLILIGFRLLKDTAKDLNAIKKNEQISGLQDIPLATSASSHTNPPVAPHTDFVSAFPRPAGDTAITNSSETHADGNFMRFSVPRSVIVDEMSSQDVGDDVNAVSVTENQFPIPAGQKNSEDKKT